MVRNSYDYAPDYAVIPGRTLREVIEDRSMSQDELAARTGLSRKTINEILSGKAPITPDTASRLDLATGVPSRIWNNLERDYREQLASLKRREEFEAEAEWAKSFPYKELATRGLVKETRDPADRVSEIFRLFGVSSRESWEAVHGGTAHVLFRKASKVQEKPFLTATWLQLARIAARKVKTTPFEQAKFRESLAEIRKLTKERPEVAVPKLTELSAIAGVAVVLVKEFDGAAISGAMFWEGDKPVIALTLRGKSWDRFWFNFFHEAAHALHHGKKQVFLDSPTAGSAVDSIEEEANSKAAEAIIPSKYNSRIAAASTDAELREVAAELGVHVCLIAGRFHHLTKKYNLWRDLMQKVDWAA